MTKMVMIMITVFIIMIIMIPSSASGNLMKKVNTDEEGEDGNKMVMIMITVLIRFPCCVLLALPWNATH